MIVINKLVGLILLISIAFSANAQDAYKANNEGWLVDMNEALKISEETGKPIMANFTGSDWCGYCIKLEKAVFSKPDFKAWAEENVVLLELDFPRRKSLPQDIKVQNNELRSAFNVTGYPTVWMFDMKMDEKGQFNVTPLGKTGYTKTSKEFLADVSQMLERRRVPDAN